MCRYTSSPVGSRAKSPCTSRAGQTVRNRTVNTSTTRIGRGSHGVSKCKVCTLRIPCSYFIDLFPFTGRFLHTHSADDIMFGNIFDRPLKLPWGFGAALRFMRYVSLTTEVVLSNVTRQDTSTPRWRKN